MTGRVLPRGACLAIALSVVACQHKEAAVRPQPATHYVVGAAWRGAAGAWFYPREALDYDTTGLAVVDAAQPDRLTADGELYDPAGIAAAHQTLQLPSVLQVTDLENGRQLLVRVNDRGPPEQGRILSLTPAAAKLLGILPGHPARVRLELQGELTRSLSSSVRGSPSLQIAAAPVEAVQEQSLPAPGSVASAATGRQTTQAGAVLAGRADMPAAMPPPRIVQGIADPGMLWIDAGQFSRRLYADQIAAAVGGTVSSQGEGRQTTYTVRMGPYQSTSDADAALDQARHDGVTGARIIVE